MNDHVDIFDTRGFWYLGTVLDRRVDSPEAVSLYVGFRVYLESGRKVDLKGRKYEGWTEQNDEWISVHSLRLQK